MMIKMGKNLKTSNVQLQHLNIACILYIHINLTNNLDAT